MLLCKWSFLVVLCFTTLFGMSQIVVLVDFKTQMWKIVTSKNYFEPSCGFKEPILLEMTYRSSSNCIAPVNVHWEIKICFRNMLEALPYLVWAF